MMRKREMRGDMGSYDEKLEPKRILYASQLIRPSMARFTNVPPAMITDSRLA
jgi:hypothetical protein